MIKEEGNEGSSPDEKLLEERNLSEDNLEQDSWLKEKHDHVIQL